MVTGQEQVARTVYQKNVSQFYANGSPGTHAEGVFGQGDGVSKFCGGWGFAEAVLGGGAVTYGADRGRDDNPIFVMDITKRDEVAAAGQGLITCAVPKDIWVVSKDRSAWNPATSTAPVAFNWIVTHSPGRAVSGSSRNTWGAS